jgi:hypothetical protein
MRISRDHVQENLSAIWQHIGRWRKDPESIYKKIGPGTVMKVLEASVPKKIERVSKDHVPEDWE